MKTERSVVFVRGMAEGGRRRRRRQQERRPASISSDSEASIHQRARRGRRLYITRHRG